MKSPNDHNKTISEEKSKIAFFPFNFSFLWVNYSDEFKTNQLFTYFATTQTDGGSMARITLNKHLSQLPSIYQYYRKP